MTRLALVMWPDTFEDWYKALGVSRSDFLEGYDREWSISLASALVSSGVELHLIHLTVDEPAAGVQQPSGANVHFVRAPVAYRAFRQLVWGQTRWTAGQRLWPVAPFLSTLSPALLRLLADLSPDAVLVQDYESLRFDVIATLSRRCALRVLGLDTGGSARPSSAPWKKWTRERAHLLLAVHAAEAKRLRDLGHERVEVWPVPVRTDVFVPGDREEARARLGIDATQRVVFSATRLHSVKNLPLLAAACADADAQLVLTGDGPERAALERLPRPPRLLGWQSMEQLVRWYAAADVVALSSNQEGQPTAVLEAYACGRAVVATAVGGVPEVVRSGATGWLVPARDRKALANALKEALSDREATDALGAAGRQLALDHHSAPAVASTIARWATDSLTGRP